MTWALHTSRQSQLQKLAVRIESPFKFFGPTNSPAVAPWLRSHGRERARAHGNTAAAQPTDAVDTVMGVA